MKRRNKMPTFSESSQKKLIECHPDLQLIFNAVIEYMDCIVLVGHRNREDQERAVAEGKSQLHFPLSAHNKTPSNAIDVAPYPIDWKDTDKFYFFGGFVLGTASRLKSQGKITTSIIWGGDWNGDGDLHNQKLFDLVHFEIKK